MSQEIIKNKISSMNFNYKKVAILMLIIAVVSVFGATCSFFIKKDFLNQKDRLESAEQSILKIRKDRVKEAFSGIVSLLELTRGFWYEYVVSEGEKELAFISLDVLANKRLSFNELERLAESVKKSGIIYLSGGEKEGMRVVKKEELPDSFDFYNSVVSSSERGTSTIEYKKNLESIKEKDELSSEQVSYLAFLYELEGDYESSKLMDEKIEGSCEEGTFCREEKYVTLRGKVVDLDGNPVQGAMVEVLDKKNAEARTNVAGEYKIETYAEVPGRVRVGVYKRNFSNGVASISLVSGEREEYVVKTVTIGSPMSVVTMNNKKGTVSGPDNTLRRDGVFVIKSDRSKYEIPGDAIVDEKENLYKGEMDVYLYEFEQGEVPSGLLEVDTFDEVRGYAGDIMKTFGMPFIQFFTPSGEELHILDTNPMVLTYNIPNMEELYRNELGLYGSLTREDMEYLKDFSEKSIDSYPIDREFLIEKNLLRFPAFWVFDQKRGVWDNIGVSVIDVDGTIKSEFYTMKK